MRAGTPVSDSGSERCSGSSRIPPRTGETPTLAPWREELGFLATQSMDLKAPQEAVLQALRHLPRNLSPEPLLREVALSLVS